MPKSGFISASKVGVLLVNGKHESGFGVGALSYAEEIARKIVGVQDEPEYTSKDMERGIELEWLAIKAYEENQLVSVHSCQEWRVHPEFNYFGGTPDGLVNDKGGVDVKCPNNSNHHKNIKTNAQLAEYYDQLQAYMFIFGREWWDLASFNDNYPEHLKLHTVRLLRDLEWQKKLSDRLPKFWAIVQQEVELLNAKG